MKVVIDDKRNEFPFEFWDCMFDAVVEQCRASRTRFEEQALKRYEAARQDRRAFECYFIQDMETRFWEAYANDLYKWLQDRSYERDFFDVDNYRVELTQRWLVSVKRGALPASPLKLVC